MTTRASQVVIQVLQDALAVVRVPQVVVEVLGDYTEGVRVPQVAVEVLVSDSPSFGNVRVPQSVVEILTDAGAPGVRVDQVTVEILTDSSTMTVTRAVQLAVEVLGDATVGGARVSQLVVEALQDDVATPLIHNLAVEFLSEYNLDAVTTVTLPPVECLLVPPRGVTQHYVVLYSTDGIVQDILDDWVSLEINHKLRDVGNHTLVMWDDPVRTPKWKLDGFVEVWWRFGDVWYLEYEGFHRTPQRTTQGEHEHFISYGRSYLDLIRRKVIAFQSTVPQTLKSGPGEKVIKEYVDENAGPGANHPLRFRSGIMPGLIVEPNQNRGDQWFGMRSGKNLLEVIQEIALATGVDFDIKRESGSFVFRCYYPQLGQDRHAYLAFALELQNMENPSYTISRTEEATIVYELGEGQGTSRHRHVEESPAKDHSPWNAIEVVDDGRETTYNGLVSAAKAKLKEVEAKESVQFGVLQTEASLYRRDYNVGDVVTMRYGAIERYKKITGATVKVSEGKVDIALDFSEEGVPGDEPVEPCPPGYSRNPTTGDCEQDPCPPGYHRNPTTGLCEQDQQTIIINLAATFTAESVMGASYAYDPPDGGGVGDPITTDPQHIINQATDYTEIDGPTFRSRHYYDPDNSSRWADASGVDWGGFVGDIDKERGGVFLAGMRNGGIPQLYYKPVSNTRNIIVNVTGVQGHHYNNMYTMEHETRAANEDDHAAPDWNDSGYATGFVWLERRESAGVAVIKMRYIFDPQLTGYTSGNGSQGPALLVERHVYYYPTGKIAVHTKFTVSRAGYTAGILDRYSESGSLSSFVKNTAPDQGTKNWGTNYLSDAEYLAFMSDGFNRNTGAAEPGYYHWYERVDASDSKNITCHKRRGLVDDDGRAFPVSEANWAGWIIDGRNPYNDPEVITLLPSTDEGLPGIYRNFREGNSRWSSPKDLCIRIAADPNSESGVGSEYYVEGGCYSVQPGGWAAQGQLGGGLAMEPNRYGGTSQWGRGYMATSLPPYRQTVIKLFGGNPASGGEWIYNGGDLQAMHECHVRYARIQCEGAHITNALVNVISRLNTERMEPEYIVEGPGNIVASWQRERDHPTGAARDYKMFYHFGPFLAGNEPTDVEVRDSSNNVVNSTPYYDPVRKLLRVSLRDVVQPGQGRQSSPTASKYTFSITRQSPQPWSMHVRQTETTWINDFNSLKRVGDAYWGVESGANQVPIPKEYRFRNIADANYDATLALTDAQITASYRGFVFDNEDDNVASNEAKAKEIRDFVDSYNSRNPNTPLWLEIFAHLNIYDANPDVLRYADSCTFGKANWQLDGNTHPNIPSAGNILQNEAPPYVTLIHSYRKVPTLLLATHWNDAGDLIVRTNQEYLDNVNWAVSFGLTSLGTYFPQSDAGPLINAMQVLRT